MSIISDICMTIDIVNSEISKDTKLFHKFRAFKNRNKLCRLIDYALNLHYLKIDMVVDFLNFYMHSVDNINYEEINIKETEDDKILNAYINVPNKDIIIQFIHNHKDDKTELRFSDKNNNFKTNIFYDIRTTSKNSNIKKYIEIANTTFKLLITKYLYDRVYIGENNGKY